MGWFLAHKFTERSKNMTPNFIKIKFEIRGFYHLLAKVAMYGPTKEWLYEKQKRHCTDSTCETFCLWCFSHSHACWQTYIILLVQLSYKEWITKPRLAITTLIFCTIKNWTELETNISSKPKLVKYGSWPISSWNYAKQIKIQLSRDLPVGQKLDLLQTNFRLKKVL